MKKLILLITALSLSSPSLFALVPIVMDPLDGSWPKVCSVRLMK